MSTPAVGRGGHALVHAGAGLAGLLVGAVTSFAFLVTTAVAFWNKALFVAAVVTVFLVVVVLMDRSVRVRGAGRALLTGAAVGAATLAGVAALVLVVMPHLGPD